jgi:hypothetical protein
MSFKSSLAAARRRVPEPDGAVKAAGRNKSPVARKVHRSDTIAAKPEKN